MYRFCVDDASMIYHWYIDDQSMTNRSIDDVSIYWWHVDDLSMTYQWRVDVLMIYRWRVDDLSMTCQWSVDQSMISQWSIDDVSMIYRWRIDVVSMTCRLCRTCLVGGSSCLRATWSSGLPNTCVQRSFSVNCVETSSSYSAASMRKTSTWFVSDKPRMM